MIKKKKLYFWIKILIPCIIISIFSDVINTNIFYKFLLKNIPDIKLFGGQIYNIAKEIILLFPILIIFLLANIRKEKIKIKKERFIESFIKGWPLFICLLPELLFILYEIIFINKGCNHYELIGLLSYCIIIGIVEELMFRKWIQNEIINEYSNTHHNIILPIILSSILFGLFHFGNFFLGQSLLNTITQVIQNTFWAMVIGAIYYKSKNIWAVIWIHAIEDFILKLDGIIPMSNYMFNYNSPIIQILKIGIIVIAIIIYIVYFIKLMSDSNLDKKKKNSSSKNNTTLIILLTSYVVFEILFIVLHLK